MWYRVGRHLTGAMELVNWTGMFYPDKEVICSWPSYDEMAELEDQGIDSVGYFLKNPNAPENKDRVFTIYHKPVENN